MHLITRRALQEEDTSLTLIKAIRAIYLIILSLVLLSVGSLLMLGVSIATLFRARRFCAEVIAKWLSQTILWASGVRLKVYQDSPFPQTQTIYTANHTSLLDLYILCALGLPKARYFMIRECWRVPPLGLAAVLMGTILTPPQTHRHLRVRCFQRAESILRKTGDSSYLTPEGQRVRTGTVGHFNKGTFHLATNLQAPIVPLYIEVPPELDSSSGVYILPGTIHVHVLPTISTLCWKLEDLEQNKTSVRQVYLDFESKLKEPRKNSRTAASYLSGFMFQERT